MVANEGFLVKGGINMKTIQTLKQLFPFHGPEKDKVAVTEAGEGLVGKVAEYTGGALCFVMFLALGPFAAIPAFFATFSIPKWLEEEKEARLGQK